MSIRKALFGIFGAALTSTGLLVADDAVAETVIKIKSQGVAIIEVENFNLADGSIVQKIASHYVWTETEGEMAGQSRGGTCIGLGQVTADGAYSGTARCNEVLSAEDAFTTTYTDNADGGDWVVTGGTGKFKGATGSGHTTYTWGDTVFGDKITMTSAGTITLP